MKTSIGRTVICKGIQSNGSDEHPAIVNRVWSDRDTSIEPVAINVTVLPDNGAPQCRSSLLLFHTRERAQEYVARNERPEFKPVVCFWPDRA